MKSFDQHIKTGSTVSSSKNMYY